MRKSVYILFFKPAGDYFLAVLILILVLPIMLGVIFINYILNGHFLFVQSRPGLNGKLFNIIKLKTLVDSTIDGERIPTRFGSFLRKSSLDEVPQIINVLKGEMSFIGPRPLLEEYLPLYNEEHSKRHILLPGITGWAQINGRNSSPWQERLDNDLYYLNNISFQLDLKIMLFSLLILIKSNGINAIGQVGSEKFKGYYAK